MVWSKICSAIVKANTEGHTCALTDRPLLQFLGFKITLNFYSAFSAHLSVENIHS